MSDAIFKKLKRQNGEKFAQAIRNFHSGILSIPHIDVILRHAGTDATPLLPYLYSLLATNTDVSGEAIGDPFDLLDQAGYEAFYADTLEKQNGIERYFHPGELLCTFNDNSRFQDYHIVHAVKKNADQITRADFAGHEERQDEYGTSVISIQMHKENAFISIKNRYNHTVSFSDDTFNSNPDNIILGLSPALKKYFGVDFSTSKEYLPDGYIQSSDGIFQYYTERNNIYYGDQAWLKDGVIHVADRAIGNALFEEFLFDNKSKTLKNIDPHSKDSFAEDFNRAYGGNNALCVDKASNLTLNGMVLIGAEKSRIKTLCLPALTTMSDECLACAKALTHFEAPALVTMGNRCLISSYALINFEAPALVTMGSSCLHGIDVLTHFKAPALTAMGDNCVTPAFKLTHFETPALVTMGSGSLRDSSVLTRFEAPALTTMGNECLCNVGALTYFNAPILTTMGNTCLHRNALTRFEAPALTTMGDQCLSYAKGLTHFEASTLITMGNWCMDRAEALVHFKASALTSMGKGCLQHNKTLTHFEALVLTTMGDGCLRDAESVAHFEAPKLTSMGEYCLQKMRAVTSSNVLTPPSVEEVCHSPSVIAQEKASKTPPIKAFYRSLLRFALA